MKVFLRSSGLVCIALIGLATFAGAQSTDQLFPTPIRSSEITSTIKARDIGDSRLTTYYYTFEGGQGDVFINVQSRNFQGDVDLFVVPGQVPLTKIVIYADQPETETGRVVYLRKPERLLLRVQGRTPGDDDASLRIKFAGSFAVSKLDESSTPPVPRVGDMAETNVRVNSVGTILEVIPKEKPTPEVVAEKVEEQKTERAVSDGAAEVVPPKADTGDAEKDRSSEAALSEKAVPKLDVVVTDPVTEEKKAGTPSTPTPGSDRASRRRRSSAARPITPAKTDEEKNAETAVVEPKKEETPARTTRARRASARRTSDPEATERSEDEKVDPMANIRLVVYFKDGSTIERPMTEVQRFAVERAVLTIVSKDGSIGRYQMIDVQRVSIE